MDSSPSSQHSIILGLSQATAESGSLPLYLSSPLEPFSLSLGLRSSNLPLPIARPLSDSQDALYFSFIPFTGRWNKEEIANYCSPSLIFLSPHKRRVEVPLATEVKRSPFSHRRTHCKAQLMVPVIVRVHLHLCRAPCTWTERSPSSANIPIGDIERTARFSCHCNFASPFPFLLPVACLFHHPFSLIPSYRLILLPPPHNPFQISLHSSKEISPPRSLDRTVPAPKPHFRPTFGRKNRRFLQNTLP